MQLNNTTGIFLFLNTSFVENVKRSETEQEKYIKTAH